MINAIGADLLYLLMLIAVLTDSKRMQKWLERVIDGLPE